MATLDEINARVSQLQLAVVYEGINNRVLIQNSIEAARLNLFNSVRADLTFVNNAVQAKVGSAQDDIKLSIAGTNNRIQTTENNLRAAVNGKGDSVLVEIQRKLDGIRADTFNKLDSVAEGIKQNILGILTPLIDEIKKGDDRVVANLSNIINATNGNILNAVQISKDLLAQTLSDLRVGFDKANAITAQIAPSIKSSLALEANSIKEALANTVVKVADDQPPQTNPLDKVLKEIFESIFGSPVMAQDDMGNVDDKFKPKIIYSGGSIDPGQNTINLDIFGNLGESLRGQLQIIATIIENAKRGLYSDIDSLTNDLKKSGVQTDIVTGIINMITLSGTLLSLGQLEAKPFITKLDRLTRDKYNLTELSIPEVLELFKRKRLSDDETTVRLKYLGLSDDDINRVKRIVYTELPLELIMDGWRKGKYTNDFLKDKLLDLGYKAEDILILADLFELRPTIQDAITFAVKEVYSPEITAKFGQFEDFPKEFAEYAKSIGLEEKYAKQYWAAHWDLPSPTMGYEMLHRGIIDNSQLKDLLRALDVMPYWREKLIQLSYNVVTRVDARRLHAYGIYNDDELTQAYLKMGYSPADAKKLTEFTIKYEDVQENPKKGKLRDLTQSVILDAYDSGLMNRQDTLNQLTSMGYDINEATLLLNIRDFDKANSKTKQVKDLHNSKLSNLAIKAYVNRSISRSDLISYLLQSGYTDDAADKEVDFADSEYIINFKSTIATEAQKQYFEGLFDENDVIIMLQGNGFTASEANRILDELTTLAKFRTKKPTVTQFTKLYKQGFIDRETYIYELLSEGYAEKYIPHMLELAGVEE